MRLEVFCKGQLHASWYQTSLVQCSVICGAMSYRADSGA